MTVKLIMQRGTWVIDAIASDTMRVQYNGASLRLLDGGNVEQLSDEGQWYNVPATWQKA